MPTLAQDVRYGLRTLLHNRAFTVVTILTLALGIGANTAIFSLLNSLILRPLNVPEPDRLVRIFSGPHGKSYEMSYPNYVDLRRSAQSYTELSVYSWPQPIILGSMSQAGPTPSERIWGTVVSGNYFKTLGVSAALGRTFAPEEDRVPGARPVVVISHALWMQKFNANAGVVGQPIRLNGRVFEIIGVAPARMLRAGLLFSTDVWVPMMMEPDAMPGQAFKLTNRGETFLAAIGRLHPGVTLAQARAEAETLASRLEREYPRQNHQFGLTVLSERDGRDMIPGVARFGWILLAVVGLLLLIACANIASLQLVRSLARRKEFGIRMSLGAGRWQLVRQLMTEGMILSLGGGLLGLGVAAVGARALLKFTPPLPLQVSLDASIDARVLLFALGVSLATGILFSILPAFRSTRLDLSGTLKAGDAGLGQGSSRMLARDVLVAGQVALSLVLLILAGLFVRSLGKANRISLGFDPANRLLASIDTGFSGYTEPRQAVFQARLLEQVRSLPGVLDVSTTAFAPLSGGYLGDGHVYIEGETPVPDYQRPTIYYDKVGDNFFRAMGTPLLAGRDFMPRDMAGPAPAAVVNQTFASTFWPGQSPLGKRFRLNAADASWIEVVGLAPDGKYRSLGESPQRHVFLPGQSSGLVLHTAGDPQQYVKALRAVVQQLDPNLPLTDVQTMNEHLGFALYPARMGASLLGLFGALGLLLAALGLFGVLSFVVRRRTRELGIRMALGAQRRNLVLLVIRQGVLLVGTGMAAGLIAAYAATRLVAGMLYGMAAHDAVTFTAVSLVLGLVALLAMYIPARHAARVDPMVALRYE